MHDVDEDIATIPAQGGYWSHGLFAGVALRDMYDTSTINASEFVASRLIYLS